MAIHTTEVECAYCHKKFLKNSHEIKRKPHERHFCSRECFFTSKTRKSFICTHCHKEYIPPTPKIGKTNFCSKECRLSNTARRNDLTGKKLGRCIVIGKDTEDPSKDHYWLLQCACKEVFSMRHKEINKGNVYECPNCIFRRSQYYIGGKKFGRLSVQDKWEWKTSETNGKRFRHWWCICECGNELWINAQSILRGHTVSCGCFFQKNNSRYVNETLYPIRHGLCGKNHTSAYQRWTMLNSKCYNSKNQSYHHYGANGYTVCDQWRNDYSSFYHWMESQAYHQGLAIDIKEGHKEFSPSTAFLCPVKDLCNRMRIATMMKKHGISYKGEVHTLCEWADILGMTPQRLKKRWESCHDIQKCIEGEWDDGSGCHMRRDDISDDEIKRLYEDGMTTFEIEETLGTRAVTYRLNKMGVKMRPRKYRSAVDNENKIKECVSQGKSLEEIMSECSYSSIYYLRRKIDAMGLKI